ncbi:hypothetical protein V2O64_13960 [Verrucomicrobiaceae bacterium 227]
MIPVAVAYLDRGQIGLWAVVNTMLSYLLWMDLGIGAATGRLMADAVANNDYDEIDRWWTATRVTLWIQGSIVIIVGILIVPFVIQWMGISADLVGDARALLFGGVIITGLSFPVRGTTGYLTAQNRFHWIPLMQAIVPWCNFIAFFVCLRLGWGLKAYLAGLLVSQVTIWICCRAFIILGPYKPKWNSTGVKKMRFLSLFKLSGNMAVVGLVGTLLKGVPTLMLARLGGLTIVPVYNFTSRAPLLGASLVGRTYQSFYPGLQRLHVSKRHQEFQKKHLEVGLVTLSGALCGAAIVLAINPVILQLIATEEYFAGMATNVWFAVAVISVPFAGLFQLLLPISGSMGKAAPLAIIKLVLSVYLAILAWNTFGLAGLAAVFALLPLVDLGYAWFRGVKACGYSYQEFSYQLLLFGSLAIVATLAAAYWMTLLDQSPVILYFSDQSYKFPSQSALLVAGGLFLVGFTFLLKNLKQLLRAR